MNREKFIRSLLAALWVSAFLPHFCHAGDIVQPEVKRKIGDPNWRKSNGELTHSDMEHLARSTAYAGGERPDDNTGSGARRIIDYGISRQEEHLTIKGDKQFRDNLAVNGLTYLDSIDNPETGLQATLVKDNATGKVIVMFRGTEPGADWASWNSLPPDVKADTEGVLTRDGITGNIGYTQYSTDRDKLNQWAAEHENLTVTAHSLGSSVGQRFIADHPEKVNEAVFFNAPAIDELTAQVANSGDLPKITYYINRDDAVSETSGGKHLKGEVIVVAGQSTETEVSGTVASHSGAMLQGDTVRQHINFETWEETREAEWKQKTDDKYVFPTILVGRKPFFVDMNKPERPDYIRAIQQEIVDLYRQGKIDLPEGKTWPDLIADMTDYAGELVDKELSGSKGEGEVEYDKASLVMSKFQFRYRTPPAREKKPDESDTAYQERIKEVADDLTERAEEIATVLKDLVPETVDDGTGEEPEKPVLPPDGESKSWSEFWAEKKAERDSKKAELAGKTGDLESRIKSLGAEESAIVEEIRELEEQKSKGTIGTEKYLEAKKKDLERVRGRKSQLQGDLEAVLRDAEEETTGSDRMVDGVETVMGSSSYDFMSWLDYFTDNMDEEQKKKFEATQRSAEVVSSEKKAAVEQAREAAEAFVDQYRDNVSYEVMVLENTGNRARDEFQKEKEGSWSTWFMDTLNSAAKNMSEGFGEGAGNVIGTRWIREQLEDDHPDQKDGTKTTGQVSRNAGDQTKTQVKKPPVSTSQNNKTSPVTQKSNKNKPGKKKKPGSSKTKSTPAYTPPSSSVSTVAPPAPPPTCSHNYQAQWVQYTCPDGSGGSRCTGYICSKCGKWSPDGS